MNNQQATITMSQPLLTEERLEAIGGLVLMSLGSFISPVWPILNNLMKPLMNIVFSTSNPIEGYLLLIQHLRTLGSHDIFFQIQLPIIGLALLQFVFITLCYKLGVYLTRQARVRRQSKIV